MAPTVARLRCRQIENADIEAVASLLARGFPAHDRRFWLAAFAQLTKHDTPAGLPKYGYLLESDGAVVGAILLICSTIPTGAAKITRCNLSSWYVDPAFRTYAPLLVSHALKHKDVTYLNVSPAPHTRPIIEAQGFSRYSEGIFIALPMVNRPFGDRNVKVFPAGQRPKLDFRVDFDASDEEVLLQHAALGCVSLWCATSDGNLSLRVPPAHREGRHSLRAAYYLPRCRRSRPLRRTDRPLSGVRMAGRSSSSTPMRQYRGYSAGSAAATCRSISRAHSDRGWATSPTPNARCSASRSRARGCADFGQPAISRPCVANIAKASRSMPKATQPVCITSPPALRRFHAAPK